MEGTEDMARYPELPMPERPRGTEQEQINRLYSALWQMTEQLNNIIHMMNKGVNENGGQ